MKKLISIMVLSFFCLSGIFAQVPEIPQTIEVKGTPEVNIPTKKYTYCELGGRWDTKHLTINAWIDYGQKDAGLERPVKYNSMIDAMNLMASKGWELVSVYTIPLFDNPTIHYILRKEIK